VTPRELLRALVSTPSVSGGERAVAAHLVDYFEGAGRDAFVDDAGNVRAPGDDSVLLTGHMDTVPGEIPVRVEDGALWGRGSVDATGALAALAAASAATGASFAGVVEEETTAAGARHLAATRDEPAAVVNGEPSGWDALALGYRGLAAATYAVETERTHSARGAPNAVEYATAWVERVRESVHGGNGFDAVSVTPVAFDGGPSADGHRVEASAEIEVRLPPDTTVGDVRAAVADCTDRGRVTWRESIPPQNAGGRSPVAAALRAGIRTAGGEPTHVHKTGTCDANVYADAWDCPVVTYGPGDSSLDHAPDERLDLAAFDRAVAVLETAGDRLCTS
jgi:LysW-gamma-L-lysine carboxypeptidase